MRGTRIRRVRLAASLALVAGASLAVLLSSALSAVSSPQLRIAINEAGWNGTPNINPFATQPAVDIRTLAREPLAFFIKDRLQFLPELAVSWKTSPTQIVINLRKNAKFHDNSRVTSKDVVLSYNIAAIRNDPPIWTFITSAKADGPYKVVLKLKKGVSQKAALVPALTTLIDPAKSWGKYVPANVQSLINAGDSGKAELAKAAGALASQQLSTYIGSGPYMIGQANQGQILLKKFPGFFGAKKLKVNTIVYPNLGTGGSAVVRDNLLLSDQLDFARAPAADSVISQFVSDGDHRVQRVADFSDLGFYFSQSKYPLNILELRKAIALVVDRAGVTKVSIPFNKPLVTPQIPILNSTAQTLLKNGTIPKAFYAGLNRYARNTAQATQLLTQAGFTKKDGKWYDPKGNKVSLTLTAVAEYGPPIVGTMEGVASYLNEFGIEAKVAPTPRATYQENLQKGNFELAWWFGGAFSALPWGQIRFPFITSSVNPATPNKSGLGIPDSVTLKGFGSVNLVDFINKWSASGDEKQATKAMLAVIEYTNSQLPFYMIHENYARLAYSTKRFKNWPPTNSPYWNDFGGQGPYMLSEMLQQGYIEPK